MQDGYPSRAPYEDLRSRFKAALPEFMTTMAPHMFVRLLLSACACSPGDYQFGQDMVFFRAKRPASEISDAPPSAVADALSGRAPKRPAMLGAPETLRSCQCVGLLKLSCAAAEIGQTRVPWQVVMAGIAMASLVWPALVTAS